MSASSSPTRRPRACSARARLVATVDLPTPPLPDATATTCCTAGVSIFAGAAWPWDMMLRSTFLALVALAELAQVVEREQPRVVAVAPGDAVGVVADRLDLRRLERHQLARLQDAQRVGRG